MKEDLSAMLPLAPAALHILLALAGEDRHGYGIIKEVARQSEHHYKLGSGTLYGNLEKLLDRGLVKEATGRTSKEDRKSTRLNSSHGYISYAVFCLKKKNA